MGPWQTGGVVWATSQIMMQPKNYKHFPLCCVCLVKNPSIAVLILGLRPVNKRQRYFVTTSLIGWVQVSNHPEISAHAWLLFWYWKTIRFAHHQWCQSVRYMYCEKIVPLRYPLLFILWGKKKMQNSTNIYPWFRRRLTYTTRHSGNP